MAAISIALGTVDTSLGALAVLEAIDPDGSYAEFVGVLVIELLLSTALAPLLRKLQLTPAPPAPSTATARSVAPAPPKPPTALAEE